MTGSLRLRALLASILVLAGLCAAAPAHAGGIAGDLLRKISRNPDSPETVRVIVRQRGTGLSASLVSNLYGGKLLRSLPVVGGMVVTLPAKDVARLSEDPGVAWVSPDRTLSRQWDYDVETIGADQVWASANLKGTGVRVAVLDTGVTSNTADWNRWGTSTSRVVAWNDLVNGSPTPYDDNGHGTHVAGVLLGSGNASGGRITGVAPDAELVAVKVLDANGEGSVSTVIQGINWCIANRTTLGIRVINLSLGHVPEEAAETDPLCQAVRQAVSSGIVVVCSAGNRGKDANGHTLYGGISSPGVEPSAITVGALNTRGTATRGDDTVATYSSRGPTYLDHGAKPDLVAPGNWIISVRAPGSTFDIQHPDVRVDPDPLTSSTVEYAQLSGTSMAAPQVAGTVALMLQANPALNPNTVKGVLMFTAEQLSVTDGSGVPLAAGLSLLTQGAGSLNAVGAVSLAGRIEASAPVGQAWVTGLLQTSSSFPGGTVQWSGAVNWGSQRRSGDAVITVRQEAWTAAVVWGAAAAWTGGVTSGDNGVAASQAAWELDAIWNTGWSGGLGGDQATWGDGPPNAFDGSSPATSDGPSGPPPPPEFNP